MVTVLHAYLLERLHTGFREFDRAAAGLTESQSRIATDPNWRRYRWGIGLNGSIAGIVRHVAAWKEIAAAGVESGRFPADNEVRPEAAGWEGLFG